MHKTNGVTVVYKPLTKMRILYISKYNHQKVNMLK